ncbi:MAG: dihydroneopterin aldolase [Hyphomicrobiales bacterium]|nr:dihydroneopterin aldolase [Hyphomicrobiales bacterium]
MLVKMQRLCVQTIAGAFDWEQKTKRNLYLTIQFTYDGTKASESDALRDALDYTTLEQEIITLLESRRFNLIETVARVVVDHILQDTRVQDVSVEVDKPGVLRQCDSVSVTLTASR